MSNVSVHETQNHLVIVIEKAVAGQAGPVVNQATPPVASGPAVTEPPPAPVPPPVPAVGPGTQNWTAGEGPAPGTRTDGDQQFLDDILRG